MCTPRKAMPQVDVADYEDLQRFATHRGVGMFFTHVEPKHCKPLQCLPEKPKLVRVKTLNKPVLISDDLYVLDGHHRWATRLHCHMLMPCWQIELSQFLFEFPKTYAYGDGNYHPWRI